METEIQGKIFKVGTVWGAIGVTSWAEAASFMAFIYSMALFGEWLWKKLIKPMMIKRGYIKADRRRKADSNE